jgi:hypothetical protein
LFLDITTTGAGVGAMVAVGGVFFVTTAAYEVGVGISMLYM